MFDIGFLELIVVFVVGLVVIGPERLPGTVRTIGRWVGKAKSIANSVKSEIEREVINQEVMNSNAHKDFVAEAQRLKESLEQPVKDIVNDITSNDSGHGEYTPDPDTDQNQLLENPPSNDEDEPKKPV